MYGGILFDFNGLGVAYNRSGMADGRVTLLCPSDCPSDCVRNSKWHIRHDRLRGFGTTGISWLSDVGMVWYYGTYA